MDATTREFLIQHFDRIDRRLEDLGEDVSDVKALQAVQSHRIERLENPSVAERLRSIAVPAGGGAGVVALLPHLLELLK